MFTTKNNETHPTKKPSDTDNLELDWLNRHLDLSERVLALLDAQHETLLSDEVSRQKRDQGKIVEFDSLMSELYNAQNTDMQVSSPSFPPPFSSLIPPTHTPHPYCPRILPFPSSTFPPLPPLSDYPWVYKPTHSSSPNASL